MIYMELASGGFASWNGERFDSGVIVNPIDAQRWSREELAEYGLCIPEPADPVPAGKVVRSTAVARIDGVPKYIHELLDAPLAEISDRQFFQALAVRGDITEAEALDAVGPGIIPPAMDALIDQLPQDQRFAARMLIRGATRYERQHPIADLIRSLYGWSNEDADDFWRFAATL